MIRAIIFDCFGVLATDAWLPFKQKKFGDSDEKMSRATELNHMVDARLISHAEFLDEVSGMAGISASELDKIMKSVAPNGPLLGYIEQELKPKYKIGMLSNVADNWLHAVFSGEQRALFDVFSLSYQTGVIKPDERAYHIAAERLGVGLGECVFIDDQERNVTGAVEVGMHAVRYRNFEQMKAELDSLLKQGS